MSEGSENESPRRTGRGESRKNAGEGNSLNSDEVSCKPDVVQSPKSRYDVIPTELKNLRQWVVWQLQERGDATTKVPFDARTGLLASTTNPETWSSFEEVVARRTDGEYDGIGFVFSETDPYIGIDFDHVLREGKWDSKALEQIHAINGYTETSPGRDGVHVIVRANLKLKTSKLSPKKLRLSPAERNYPVKSLKRLPIALLSQA